jgi:predicted CoA-binding protein
VTASTGDGVRSGVARLRRVLGDGARWIWTAAAEQFGERIEIVDWYHAAEHVWTVVRAVSREDSPAGSVWAEAA